MAPLLLVAFLALAPEARAADPARVSIEAPLDQANPRLSGPTVPLDQSNPRLDAAIQAPALDQTNPRLQLPPSVLPAGPAISAAPPAEASAPAWTQASPQAYAAAPQAAGRAVAAAPKPYFVAALEKAGVEPSLAKDLNEYLSAPGRHPGPQDMVYHGLHHSYDVAALAARLTETPEGRTLTKEQRILLILSASLHDVDPRRARMTAASVDRTLAYIDDDPSTRQIIDRFAGEYGFNARQIKALIKATDFSPDPLRAEQLEKQADQMLGTEFKGAEWAKTWAKHLAFADQIASYVSDTAYADRQVRGLANEFQMTPINAAVGTRPFLQYLRGLPDYAILPAELQANFETVLKRYEDIDAHPESYAKDFPPNRGPPETDAVLYAKAAAAQPVSPELDAQLARFSKTGATILSAPGAMDPAILQALLRSVAGVDQTRDYELFERPGEMLKRSRPDFDGWKENRAGVRGFVARMEYLLNRAAPGENIIGAKVGLRVEVPAKEGRSAPGVPTPHVDGRYLTVTIALEGPGTDVWDDSSGKVESLHALPGEVVAQTAVDRAMRLGVPGTVHASPVGWNGRRVLLVINFVSDGYANPRSAEAGRYQESRAAAVIRRWGASGQKPEPPKAGILGKLKKILE